MLINNETKLLFAIDNVANLEALNGENEYETYLSQNLSTMKYELVRQLDNEQNRKKTKRN